MNHSNSQGMNFVILNKVAVVDKVLDTYFMSVQRHLQRQLNDSVDTRSGGKENWTSQFPFRSILFKINDLCWSYEIIEDTAAVNSSAVSDVSDPLKEVVSTTGMGEFPHNKFVVHVHLRSAADQYAIRSSSRRKNPTADCVVTTDSKTMRQICLQQLTVMTAYFQGKLKLIGDRKSFKAVGLLLKGALEEIAEEVKAIASKEASEAASLATTTATAGTSASVVVSTAAALKISAVVVSATGPNGLHIRNPKVPSFNRSASFTAPSETAAAAKRRSSSNDSQLQRASSAVAAALRPSSWGSTTSTSSITSTNAAAAAADFNGTADDAADSDNDDCDVSAVTDDDFARLSFSRESSIFVDSSTAATTTAAAADSNSTTATTNSSTSSSGSISSVMEAATAVDEQLNVVRYSILVTNQSTLSQWQVSHRYSDFIRLRQQLLKQTATAAATAATTTSTAASGITTATSSNNTAAAEIAAAVAALPKLSSRKPSLIISRTKTIAATRIDELSIFIQAAVNAVGASNRLMNTFLAVKQQQQQPTAAASVASSTSTNQATAASADFIRCRSPSFVGEGKTYKTNYLPQQQQQQSTQSDDTTHAMEEDEVLLQQSRAAPISWNQNTFTTSRFLIHELSQLRKQTAAIASQQQQQRGALKVISSDDNALEMSPQLSYIQSLLNDNNNSSSSNNKIVSRLLQLSVDYWILIVAVAVVIFYHNVDVQQLLRQHSALSTARLLQNSFNVISNCMTSSSSYSYNNSSCSIGFSSGGFSSFSACCENVLLLLKSSFAAVAKQLLQIGYLHVLLQLTCLGLLLLPLTSNRFVYRLLILLMLYALFTIGAQLLEDTWISYSTALHHTLSASNAAAVATAAAVKVRKYRIFLLPLRAATETSAATAVAEYPQHPRLLQSLLDTAATNRRAYFTTFLDSQLLFLQRFSYLLWDWHSDVIVLFAIFCCCCCALFLRNASCRRSCRIYFLGISLIFLYSSVACCCFLLRFSDDSKNQLYDLIDAAVAPFVASEIAQLRSIFTKFAQYFGGRSDVVSARWCAVLSELHDSCPHSSAQYVRETVQRELSGAIHSSINSNNSINNNSSSDDSNGSSSKEVELLKIEDIFSSFDFSPIASASIGQVHVARIRRQQLRKFSLLTDAIAATDTSTVDSTTAAAGSEFTGVSSTEAAFSLDMNCAETKRSLSRILTATSATTTTSAAAAAVGVSSAATRQAAAAATLAATDDDDDSTSTSSATTAAGTAAMEEKDYYNEEEGVHNDDDDGEVAVVVKVQHECVAETMFSDMRIAHWLLSLAALFDARWAPLKPILRSWEDAMRGELDFREEANNLTEVAANMKRSQLDAAVPVPVPKLNTRKVLVMTRLFGYKVTDKLALVMHGVDRAALLSRLAHCCAHQLLVAGVFNADPHAGNVMFCLSARDTNEIIPGLLDFGMTVRLSPERRRAYCRLLLALFSGDFIAAAAELKAVGYKSNQSQRAPERDAEFFEFIFRDANNSNGASQKERAEFTSLRSSQKQRDVAAGVSESSSGGRSIAALPDDFLFLTRLLGLLRGLAAELDCDCPLLQILAMNARMGLQQQ